MSKTTVTVVGATGYAGAELVRLLERHPVAEVVRVTSSRHAGRALSDECPWLASHLFLEALPDGPIDSEFVFLCQESGFAMQHARTMSASSRVIDLSADFRLKDPGTFQRYYGKEHVDPELPAVYGLPELVDRSAIADAVLVANPGCYPTASLLALMPLVRSGLVKGVPVIDAKSGVSGAGRSRTETEYLFTEVDNSFKPYGVQSHRHTPEIEQMAERTVRFTPHLVPMARGLEATVYVETGPVGDLMDLYREFYDQERFVRVSNVAAATKVVVGSNACVIFPYYDERTGYAVICSVLDNLVKGAAGQAIQNMNIMLGIAENAGLPESGLWP